MSQPDVIPVTEEDGNKSVVFSPLSGEASCAMLQAIYWSLPGWVRVGCVDDGVIFLERLPGLLCRVVPVSGERVRGGANRVGRGVRERRLALGWSQAELGERSGIRQARISLIEKGGRVPRRLTVERLAVALGCEVSDLLGG